jgi:hypothetical protein
MAEKPKVCQAKGCTKKGQSLGLCPTHYKMHLEELEIEMEPDPIPPAKVAPANKRSSAIMLNGTQCLRPRCGSSKKLKLCTAHQKEADGIKAASVRDPDLILPVYEKWVYEGDESKLCERQEQSA